MRDRRRRIVRAVFWAGVVAALAAGVTLAVLDHLLLVSGVLIASAFLLGPLAWLTDPPPSGRMDPQRLWKIARLALIVSALVAFAGVVLLLVAPGTLGSWVLMTGISMAFAGLFIRYTVRMDHPHAPAFTPAEPQR